MAVTPEYEGLEGEGGVAMRISEEVSNDFPGLQVLTSLVRNVVVKRSDPELEEFKEDIVREIRERYDIETLRERPIIRAYRDFFWRLGVDPTKTRPAVEALIRRLLHGRPLPRINTLVDAYNLASIRSEIAIAAFDLDRLGGKLTMRYAGSGEEFLGIGMKSPMRLNGGEIVISDGKRLVAIYPYRDAEATKVTEETRNVLLLFCGVPGIPTSRLSEAKAAAVGLVTRFCGGTVKD